MKTSYEETEIGLTLLDENIKDVVKKALIARSTIKELLEKKSNPDDKDLLVFNCLEESSAELLSAIENFTENYLENEESGEEIAEYSKDYDDDMAYFMKNTTEYNRFPAGD